MSNDQETPVVLCQDALVRLSKDLTLPDGRVVPEGTLALLLPQTTAECVLTPDGKSLSAVWSSLSRLGHTHPEIAQFSAELINLARRVTELEIKLEMSENTQDK